MQKQLIATLICCAFVASCASETQKPSMPDLLKTEWLLEDLAGKGVLDRAQATLAFPEPNKVAGNGSCNRFFGAVQINGAAIKFGNLASTRMACLSEAVANQEANYLKALQNAEKLSFDEPYLLIYSQGLDQPLRFTQIIRHGKP